MELKPLGSAERPRKRWYKLSGTQTAIDQLSYFWSLQGGQPAADATLGLSDPDVTFDDQPKLANLTTPTGGGISLSQVLKLLLCSGGTLRDCCVERRQRRMVARGVIAPRCTATRSSQPPFRLQQVHSAPTFLLDFRLWSEYRR
jgi:hypothetical protein